MTDTITTTAPKSAAAELEEYKVWAEYVRINVEATAIADLAARPAAEVIEEAKAEAHWTLAKHMKTKKAAVRVLARAAWQKTDVAQKLEALSEAADKEARVLKAIKGAPERLEVARLAVAEQLAKKYVDYERVVDAALDARKVQIKAELWDAVAKRTTFEEKPETVLDAFEAVRLGVVNELTGPYTHKATSRSTSVTRNLDDDVALEAKAEWLNRWESHWY